MSKNTVVIPVTRAQCPKRREKKRNCKPSGQRVSNSANMAPIATAYCNQIVQTQVQWPMQFEFLKRDTNKKYKWRVIFCDCIFQIQPYFTRMSPMINPNVAQQATCVEGL